MTTTLCSGCASSSTNALVRRRQVSYTRVTVSCESSGRQTRGGQGQNPPVARYARASNQIIRFALDSILLNSSQAKDLDRRGHASHNMCYPKFHLPTYNPEDVLADCATNARTFHPIQTGDNCQQDIPFAFSEPFTCGKSVFTPLCNDISST